MFVSFHHNTNVFGLRLDRLLDGEESVIVMLVDVVKY